MKSKVLVTSNWKEFRLEDLFEILTPQQKFNAIDIVDFNGKYPYVVRSKTNNGIKGYINQKEEFLNQANTISFGQDTATMFYQNQPYFTGDKIKILVFKEQELNIKFNDNLALFLIPILNKAFQNFNWGSSSYNINILKK